MSERISLDELREGVQFWKAEGRIDALWEHDVMLALVDAVEAAQNVVSKWNAWHDEHGGRAAIVVTDEEVALRETLARFGGDP